MTLDKTPRRKVWVEVEVDEERPGAEYPRLLRSVDPDKARAAFLDLRKFTPGYGPSELFREGNPFYQGPRTLEAVIKGTGRDPQAIMETLRAEEYARIEASAAPTDAKVQERKERIDRVLLRALTEPSTDRWVGLYAEKMGGGWTLEHLRRGMEGDAGAPFFTEAYLYTLLGKDIARSILGGMRLLALALGVERDD